MIYRAQLSTTLRSRTKSGEQDTLTHSVEAMVSVRDDGSWSLRYHDPDNGGQTALAGTAAWMTLQREGNIRSRMRFALDAFLPALYVTQLGAFDMATRTDHYAAEVSEHDGRITLDYDLLLSGELAVQNRLEVIWHRLPA